MCCRTQSIVTGSTACDDCVAGKWADAAVAAVEGTCTDLSFEVGGIVAPWHERNGVGNTCAIMTQHGYCGTDYFNTYNGVKVFSAEACCGCGGGVSTGGCTSCAAGKANAATGSVAETACTDCAGGETSVPPFSACSNCAVGKISAAGADCMQLCCR